MLILLLRHLVKTTFRQAMVNLQMSISRISAHITAIAVFAWQLGGYVTPKRHLEIIALTCRPSAISIAIGQTITLSTFVNRIPHDFPNGLAATMIATGPTSSLHSALSPKDLDILRGIWNLAVTRTMFLALAMVCMALPCTLAMEWLNAKEIADAREAESDRSRDERTAHSLSELTGSKTLL